MSNKEKVLQAAKSIGDHILSTVENENPLLWKTLGVDINKNYYWRSNESLYTGSSGIVLFLLELYRTTSEEKYLDVALTGINRVTEYCSKTPSSTYSFFIGRLGVCFTLACCFQQTGDYRYLESAIQLAEPIKKIQLDTHSTQDLLTGTAGIILGLGHLYSFTNDKHILDELERFINFQISSARIGREGGLYWDRDVHIINGLCGFSHGSSGIGFALLEVGHLLDRVELNSFAEECFLYEKAYFDQKQNNWADLRKPSFSQENIEDNKRAYQDSNLKYFFAPNYQTAWCHGAPGIGLSRLRALELLGNADYKTDSINALNNTIQTLNHNSFKSYTLCHGDGGNAELLIEAESVLKNPYSNQVEQIALSAIEQKHSTGIYLSGMESQKDEDTSLFLGSSGIGYFFLRLLNPNVPSILLPRIRKQKEKGRVTFNHKSYRNILDTLYQRHFPRTVDIITAKKITDEEYPEVVQNVSIEAFENYIRTVSRLLPINVSERIEDVYKLESNIFRSDAENYSLLHTESLIVAQTNTELLQNNSFVLFDSALILNPRVILVKTKWNWSRGESLKNLNIVGEPTDYLLFPTSSGVIEYQLNVYVRALFDCACKETSFNLIVQELLAKFPKYSFDQFYKFAIHQIGEAMKSGILVSVHDYEKINKMKFGGNGLHVNL